MVQAVSVAQHMLFSHLPPNNSRSKTLAQQLWEDDRNEDEELFALIAGEVSAPTWITPVVVHFPAPARSESPLSAISTDSCSSYCSSDSCSCFSATTASTLSSKSDKQSSKLSRREKAKQVRVFVDISKTEVTPYDGGKTTVLTGGVMLGTAPPQGQERPVCFCLAPRINGYQSASSNHSLPMKFLTRSRYLPIHPFMPNKLYE